MSDATTKISFTESSERRSKTDEGHWIATLSDGSTAVEHSGEFKIVPGERKPWVRLCTFAADQGLHLTSMRFNFRGRTLHMPRANFDRFGLNEFSQTPLSYSLQYHYEGEMSDVFGGFHLTKQTHFIDLAAHYEGFVVHYILDITDGNNSWVVVTQGAERLAESPRNVE